MKRLLFGIFISTIVFSCNTSSQKNEKTETTVIDTTTKTKALVGMINGTIYSIPSPYSIMNYLQSIHIPYYQNIPNSVENLNFYESTSEKALNLGIYGIDISYMTLYEQTGEALNYFAALKTLTNQLELTTVFDASTMDRLETNMGNKDSILLILTNKLRDSDKMLKSENQKAEAALIMTGGWIESLYILTQIEKKKHNDNTVQRIGEYKYAAETLLNILRPYYMKSSEYQDLIDDLVEICYIFDGVESEYSYQKPIHIPEQQKTIITSTSTLKIMPEHITLITEKIEKMRNSIIQ